jgi:serine/threonine-protein kinase
MEPSVNEGPPADARVTRVEPANQQLLPPLPGYEIVRELGQGGMGIVWLARDLQTKSLVAIKTLRPEFQHHPRILAYFLKEARHMAQLTHPHILPIKTISEPPSEPWYIMPYLESGSLARLITPGQPVDCELLLRISTQVAEALAYAHDRGIIHRDLKPANVLLDEQRNVWLADFGLARSVFNDSLLDPAQQVPTGTPAYMSPDVARGKAEDTRCDIYAFGALLYELLTGSPPYDGPSGGAIVRQILAGPPEPILKRNSAAPAGLVAIANGCMARELRDRYASMRDVLTDLNRVQRGQQPLGPHWRRTAPLAWLAAGALAAAVVAGIIMLTMALNQPRPPNPSPGTDSRPASADTLRVKAFDVRLYRGQSLQYLGTFGKSPLEAHADDSIRIHVELSEPAYCYVLAFHPNGQQELYPQDEKDRPPALTASFVLPRTEGNGYGLTDGVGLQAFALVASRKELAPYAQWQAAAGPFPWQAVQADGVWCYDGESFSGGPRGQERPLGDVPEPFKNLCSFLKTRPGIDAVQAVAFPVKPRPKDEQPGEKNN